MAELVIPRLLKQAVIVHMSKDAIKLDIHDIVSKWDSYNVCLDIEKPGKKVRINLICDINLLMSITDNSLLD